MTEPAEGSVPAGDFEPVPQALTEIAQEVIAGHWGRGQKRNQRLEAAGFNAEAVNKEVIKIFKGE